MPPKPSETAPPAGFGYIQKQWAKHFLHQPRKIQALSETENYKYV